jgi:2,4-dienoyl-CoA reductase (NADPH2)
MSDTSNPAYPHLLAPLRIGRHTLKNRVIMGSMHTRLEQAQRSVERRVAFYEERARGAVAMIITAGYSPNAEGRLEADAQVFDSADQLSEHRPVTAAVHAHGATMLLQILHAGRYAKHDLLVAPSAIASPISKRIPRVMSIADIERTIADFARTAELAAEGGYDGVELMGSEGYLLNQFCALRTNQRQDQWGGPLENRCALPLEIIRSVRARTGPDFLIAYRISALDLVEQGLNGEEIDYLARLTQSAGADLLSTGIGWHESPVPTIAYHVPRAAWSFATARLKAAVTIPVIAANRINTPETAEEILARGDADLVSLARPLLADPQFVTKMAAGRADEINTCIACNQACLDYIFRDQTASCLVNPQAGREIEFDAAPAQTSKRIGVAGAGPAGLAFAIQAAARGHKVVLFEAGPAIGGQLNLASRIPGKSEFLELLRYFRVQLARHGVEVRLRAHVTPTSLLSESFDHIVVATGSVARNLDLAQIDVDKVANYAEIISGAREAGSRVAIIGTGGIGHDVAELLTSSAEPQTAAQFFAEWGVDPTLSSQGALRKPYVPAPARFVQMFQRSQTRPGARLGVSTGWILRKKLMARGVEVVSGCEYLRIDQFGLHYRVGGQVRLAEVDTVVTCAGQEPETDLPRALTHAGVSFDVIGGARAASELDATRAISEGARLAFVL